MLSVSPANSQNRTGESLTGAIQKALEQRLHGLKKRKIDQLTRTQLKKYCCG